MEGLFARRAALVADPCRDRPVAATSGLLRLFRYPAVSPKPPAGAPARAARGSYSAPGLMEVADSRLPEPTSASPVQSIRPGARQALSVGWSPMVPDSEAYSG